MAKKHIILTGEFEGKTYALTVKDGFTMGSKFYGLQSLTPAFFLAADPKITLVMFGNKSEAASVSTTITEDVESAMNGRGTRNFIHGIPKSRFKNLRPTEIELSLNLTPCAQK